MVSLSFLALVLPLILVPDYAWSLLGLIGQKQRYKVGGVLLCGDKPYKGADVRLVNKNPLKDSTLGSIVTKDDGVVNIDGTSTEMSKIDVVLKIYHKCDQNKTLLIIPKCQRRWAYRLPEKYISAASDPKPPTFQLGTVNLEPYWEDERTDCFHP